MRNIMIIAGPGDLAYGDKEVEKMAKNISGDSRTVICIGNGTDEVKSADLLEQLEKMAKNGNPTTIIIHMHGTNKNGQFYFINGDQYVSSKELFEKIGFIFGERAVDMVVTACNGGACLGDVDLLPKGSVVGACSQGDQTTAGSYVAKLIDGLSEDKGDLTAFHLMQKYMIGLDSRIPPEIGLSGCMCSIQFGELLRRSIGKKFDREKIASLLGEDIGIDYLNSIIDKIETGKNEWDIKAKEYGKAMAICLANEFGDVLSKDNFKSIVGKHTVSEWI